MHLVFGLACDGRTCPDFPGAGEGALDSAVVGPSGLVDMLELQLGLTGPRVAEAVRVAAYAAKLSIALADKEDLFFAASFARDPWATSGTLLAWRDALLFSGWNGASVGSLRPDALAMAESVGPTLPSGLADRFRGLLGALSTQPRLAVDSVRLVEFPETLPPPWRALLEAIAACGVVVQSPHALDPAPSGTDLARVQRFLEGSGAEPLCGDGTFVRLDADTTLSAAEAVAEWLAAGSEAELAGTVVVCPDGDTALLDRALQSRGLPALGLSAPSPFRGALQVLPLAFACAWAPFDATALLNLLMLPRPPIGRRAARQLVKALATQPGVGGPRWHKAWDAIEKDLRDRFGEQEDGDTEVGNRLEQLRDWTRVAVADRKTGMTVANARSIAGRVGAWAMRMDAGRGDPLLVALAGSASALSAAIEVLGQEPLSAILLERMIAQVLADGEATPPMLPPQVAFVLSGIRAHSGHASTASSGGASLGPANACGRHRSRAESEALAQAGCLVECRAAAAARISLAAGQVIRRAGRQTILVRPSLSGDDATTSHPLEHQLHSLLQPAGELIRIRAEALHSQASISVAGRIVLRDPLAVQALPAARSHWNLPAEAIGKLASRQESATSFGRMVDCQLRWVLQDVLKLQRGRFAEIPGADQLIGEVAHALAQRVFPPGLVPNDEVIRATVEDTFDSEVAMIAAPLLQPEHAGELAAARHRVPLALRTLATFMRERGVTIVGTELSRETNLGDGYAVNGRIDLLVNHPARGPGVIDLKWTRSAKRRRDEIAEGRSIQLATYGAIVEPGRSVPGAYYLLRQRRLIGPTGSFVAEEEIEFSRDLVATWQDLLSTWRTWRSLTEAGTVLALGLSEAGSDLPGALAVEPGERPCRYCELTSLCRVTEEAGR